MVVLNGLGLGGGTGRSPIILGLEEVVIVELVEAHCLLVEHHLGQVRVKKLQQNRASPSR